MVLVGGSPGVAARLGVSPRAAALDGCGSPASCRFPSPRLWCAPVAPPAPGGSTPTSLPPGCRRASTCSPRGRSPTRSAAGCWRAPGRAWWPPRKTSDRRCATASLRSLAWPRGSRARSPFPSVAAPPVPPPPRASGGWRPSAGLPNASASAGRLRSLELRLRAARRLGGCLWREPVVVAVGAHEARAGVSAWAGRLSCSTWRYRRRLSLRRAVCAAACRTERATPRRRMTGSVAIQNTPAHPCWQTTSPTPARTPSISAITYPVGVWMRASTCGRSRLRCSLLSCRGDRIRIVPRQCLPSSNSTVLDVRILTTTTRLPNVFIPASSPAVRAVCPDDTAACKRRNPMCRGTSWRPSVPTGTVPWSVRA